VNLALFHTGFGDAKDSRVTALSACERHNNISSSSKNTAVIIQRLFQHGRPYCLP